MRGAHVEHVAHVRDAGRVEAQRLVERRRVLPSRKEGVRCRSRCGLGGGRTWAGGSARAACTARGPGCEGGGAKACAERTLNMPSMSVTLDVSKLSGWLNAAAPCRVERRGVRCGARCGPGAGGRGPAAAHERHARREGPAVKAGGAKACAERTQNMRYMVVTLDVSKLSGWLNADAFCRVESRAYDAGRGAGRGREGMGRRQRTSAMHGKRTRL
eukprot:scaffold17599_cov43-Phaeocystis_antarctica.AAC.1